MLAWGLREDFPAVFFAAVAMLAIIGALRPQLGILAAVALSPTFGWVVVEPDVSAFQVIVVVTAVGTAVQRRRELVPLGRRILTAPEGALAVAFVSWVVVAALANPSLTEPAFVRNYIGGLALMLLVAVNMRTGRSLRLLLGALVLGTTATALVGLAQLVSTDALVGAWVLPDLRGFQDTYLRLASPWGLGSVGSDFSKDVLIGLSAAVGLAVALRGRARLVASGAVVVLALALASSGSRSSWVGGIAALVFFAAFCRNRFLTPASLVLAGFLAVLTIQPALHLEAQSALGLAGQGQRAGVELTFPQPDGAPRSVPLVVGGERDALSTEISGVFRARLNEAAFDIVKDNPIVGVGPGGFQEVVDQYIDRSPIPAYDTLPERLAPHNVFAATAAETGLLGGLLYIALIATAIARLVLLRNRLGAGMRGVALGSAAGLLGFSVTSAFHNYQFDNLFWTLLGVSLALWIWPGARAIEDQEDRTAVT